MTLIDAKVLNTISPNIELSKPVRLVSASGHNLDVLGTCCLTVQLSGTPACEWNCCVVSDLSHDLILGFDFLQANHVVVDCSPSDATRRIKLRISKPVSVPAQTAMCISVKIDRKLASDREYLMVGQCSGNLEIHDSLIKPFGDREIPVYVRNRTDKLVTLHRRSVVGFVEMLEEKIDFVTEPEIAESDSVVENNAVSADDGQFLGESTDEVLSRFEVGEQVTGQQRDELATLLKSHSGVFSRNYADIGNYNGGEVDLELQPGTRPQFVRPYPVPWARETQLRSQLDDLQHCGVLEQGPPSDWNSPILLVPKGGNSTEYRIVQDMRCINKCLLPKKFVFPNIDDFLFSLQGWQVASSLDIKHAFWNLRLTKESSHICAFHALGKTFYPQRMPMGCMQSSYFLHVAMHKILGDVPGVHVYADDVLLTSANMDDHYKLLSTVLIRLESAGLKLSPSKCSIGVTRLNYLGHEITPNGISIASERVQCIRDLKVPRTVKEVKKLYGFFSWFRKFIPSFSTLATPLVDLSNSPKFYWNAELDESFRSLRDALLRGPVLSYPRQGDRFVLYTDSSISGSGQVLCQIQDGAEKVIAYGGSKYNRAQRKWTIFELEVYSFIQGLRRFYKYLEGDEFTWHCDCKSALQILSNRDELNPRIARWRSFAGQFRFVTQHKRAVEMQHVDFLSRMHEDSGDEDGAGRAAEEPAVGGGNPAPRGDRPIEPARSADRDGAGAAAADRPAGAERPGDGRLPSKTVDSGVADRGSRIAQSAAAPSHSAGCPGEETSGMTAPISHEVPAGASVTEVDRDNKGPERTSDGTMFVSHDGTTNASVTEDARSSYGGEQVSETNAVAADCLIDCNIEPGALIWHQKHDKNCRALAFRLRTGKWPRYCPAALKRETVDNFTLRQGILYRKGSSGSFQIVWPIARRFEMLYRHHDTSTGAHCGADKLYEILSRSIWYLGLKGDCHSYVASCELCSAKKSDRGPPRPPLLPQSPTSPGEVLVVDVVHLPQSRLSGKTLVLTCIDKFTGFLTFYPLVSGAAENVVDALSTQFLTFGPPQRIETDAGTNMKSDRVAELCRFWGVERRHAVGFHHEAIGKLERRHRDIKLRIRTLTENYGTDWETHLPAVVFSLNNEVSASHGFSPYFLYFMRHVNSPVSRLISVHVPRYSEDYVHEKMRMVAGTLKRAHETIRQSQYAYKRAYDLRYRVREPRYKPGDQVRIRSFDKCKGVSRKMCDPWSCVHIVVSLVGRRHVDCLDPRTGRTRRTHVKYLKPVVERDV